MAKTSPDKVSTLVSNFVRSRAAIQECLRLGVVNYTALARLIGREEKIKNLPAAVAACRRVRGKIAKAKGRDEEVTAIIRGGRLLMRSHLVMVLLDHPRSYEKLAEVEAKIRAKRGTFNMIDGEESLAIITGREYLGEIRKAFSRYEIDVFENLVQLSFIFPRKAITTPGVAARLYGLLSSANINVYGELTSCGDHLVVIHERDLIKALSLVQPGERELHNG